METNYPGVFGKIYRKFGRLPIYSIVYNSDHMQKMPKALIALDGLSIIAVLIATGMVFFYAPLETTMGAVQKVFYFHVSAGWVGMLSFLATTICGIIYLLERNMKWDLAGQAGVEIGLVFTLVCIVSGSIWARPTWNTWWIWDPRLTTAAIMALIYAAYLMLRQGIEEPERRARFAAVYAIVGFISVPLTFLSIRLFRTIHPLIIASGGDSQGLFAMTPRMTQTFLFSLLAFSILFAAFFWHRIRLGTLAKTVEEQKLSIEGD
jgi:heme exporter protein C